MRVSSENSGFQGFKDEHLLSFFLGYRLFDSKRKLDNNFEIGLRYADFFEPMKAWEAGLGVVSTIDSDSNDRFFGEATFDIIQLMPPKATYIPYYMYGASMASVQKTRLGFNFGAGFFYPLDEDSVLRAEVRDTFILKNGQNDITFSIAYGLFMTNKKVHVDKDTDRDGVFDHLDACPETPLGAKVDDQGCATSVRIEIQFASGSSEIQNQYFSELTKYARFLKTKPNMEVEIQGHTDDRGGVENNLALSQRRASTVYQYLVNELEIDSNRISAKGYGESNPIASNDTEAGRSLNRRIEAVTVKK